MNKVTITAITLILACVACADTDPIVKFGGKGELRLVSCGATAKAPLEAAAKEIETVMHIRVSVTNVAAWSVSAADRMRKDLGATAAVFVADDAVLPVSLLALESRWMFVNTKGLSEKSVKREIMRTLLVFFSSSSQVGSSLLHPAFSAEDVEKRTGDDLTIDVLIPALNGMSSFGFEAYALMPKSEAEAAAAEAAAEAK